MSGSCPGWWCGTGSCRRRDICHDLRAVDVDIGDLALSASLSSWVRLTSCRLARSFDDELPKEDQAGDHEDPDQNLFDGRVQSVFPHFRVCSFLMCHGRDSDFALTKASAPNAEAIQP